MTEVELPDGTVLQVETDDPAQAANAAKAYLAKSQAKPDGGGIIGTANDFLSKANNMLMMGAEPLYKGAAAAIGETFKGPQGQEPEQFGQRVAQAFSQGRQDASENQDRIKRERPFLSVAAETTGGALPMLATMGAAAPQMAGAQVSKTARPLMDIAKTGAGYGAAYGGLDTASREGVKETPEILQGMGKGAVTGAVLAPLLTKGAEATVGLGEAGARLIKRIMSSLPQANRSQVNMGLGGFAGGARTPQPPAPPRITGEQKAAGRQVARSWINDEVTPEQVLATQQARADRGGGKLDTNAEAAGPNSVETLRAFMTVPGPAKARGEKFMEARAEGAPSRIKEAANAQLNPQGANLYDELDRLTASQKEVSGPLFAQSDKTPVTPEDMARLKPLLDTPAGREALAQGKETYANLRQGSGDQVDFKTLRAMRDGLDDMIEGFRNPITGKLDLNNKGRSIVDLRKALDRELKGMSKERTGDSLAQADKAFGGPARQKTALDAGRKIFTTDAELSAARLAKMSDDAVRAYQIGVARAIVDRAAGVTDGPAANYAGKIAGKQLLRERLRPAFKDEASFEAFMIPIQDEVRRVQTARNTLPSVNSKTAPSAMALTDIFADMAASGSPAAAGKKAFADMIQRMRMNSPLNTKVNQAAADMMLGTADDAATTLAPAIREYSKQRNRQNARQTARGTVGRTAAQTQDQ